MSSQSDGWMLQFKIMHLGFFSFGTKQLTLAATLLYGSLFLIFRFHRDYFYTSCFFCLFEIDHDDGTVSTN